MTETYNDKESYFYTANIKVATALATMGFAMKQPEPVTRMVRPDGKESTIFWFDDLSTTGAKARDVVLGMTKEGDALDASDPENPINYIRAALLNRDTLVELVCTRPFASEYGDFTLHIFRNKLDGRHHLAFALGAELSLRNLAQGGLEARVSFAAESPVSPASTLG